MADSTYEVSDGRVLLQSAFTSPGPIEQLAATTPPPLTGVGAGSGATVVGGVEVEGELEPPHEIPVMARVRAATRAIAPGDSRRTSIAQPRSAMLARATHLAERRLERPAEGPADGR
jgi:hypothetical protein